MNPFVYPDHPHERRHEPAGYKDYESYREWLRDEFNFMCIYTLLRETWFGRDCFQIEHVVPQNAAPELECEYTNLVYAYHFLNRLKSAKIIPDPCTITFSECFEVDDQGELHTKSDLGVALEKDLCLKNPTLTKKRRDWILILTNVQKNPRLYQHFMGPPSDLVDLRMLKPPENHKPEGIAKSHFARKNNCAISPELQPKPPARIPT